MKQAMHSYCALFVAAPELIGASAIQFVHRHFGAGFVPFFRITVFAARNAVLLIRLASPRDRDQMIHGQFRRFELEFAVVTNTFS